MKTFTVVILYETEFQCIVEHVEAKNPSLACRIAAQARIKKYPSESDTASIIAVFEGEHVDCSPYVCVPRLDEVNRGKS